MPAQKIWTVGHSTRGIEELIGILNPYRIELILDVRRFPGSRRYPQFNESNLRLALGRSGIDYRHFEALGGRRVPRADSMNIGWRNAAFRGYADPMQTVEFQKALGKLNESATEKRTAIMCAEAVWWRCHRALISDQLKAEGIRVTHIISENKEQEHPYTSAAVVLNGRVSYGPAATPLLPDLREASFEDAR